MRPLATVRETNPRLQATLPANHEPPELTQARLTALAAQKLVGSDPTLAMVHGAAAARLSLGVMKATSGYQADEATAIYNFSVARLIEAINKSRQEPWKQPIKLDGPDGPFWLNMTSDSLSTWNPATDKLKATDRMMIGGRYFKEPAGIKGVGAPLVSTGPGRTDPPWVPLKHFVPATALASFSGNHGTIRIVNPYRHPR